MQKETEFFKTLTKTKTLRMTPYTHHLPPFSHPKPHPNLKIILEKTELTFYSISF